VVENKFEYNRRCNTIEIELNYKVATLMKLFLIFIINYKNKKIKCDMILILQFSSVSSYLNEFFFVIKAFVVLFIHELEVLCFLLNGISIIVSYVE